MLAGDLIKSPNCIFQLILEIPFLFLPNQLYQMYKKHIFAMK